MRVTVDHFDNENAFLLIPLVLPAGTNRLTSGTKRPV